MRDEAGEIVQYFASFVDLTKHKLEEAHSKMLIEELNHRVKNTLATVQSIVRQGLRSASDPKVMQNAIESRLFALSRSHDLLTRENWKSASIGDVLVDALSPYTADGGADRIVISGDTVRFKPRAALALGVAFNELATNAVKYGALSNAAGSILIDWRNKAMPQGDRFVLNWRERDGPLVTPPSRKGFGSRMIERGLAHELQGTVHLSYPESGVVCTIDIPAEKGAQNE